METFWGWGCTNHKLAYYCPDTVRSSDKVATLKDEQDGALLRLYVLHIYKRYKEGAAQLLIIDLEIKKLKKLTMPALFKIFRYLIIGHYPYLIQ